MEEWTKYPSLDGRTERELLELMDQRAKSYVPEWRFNLENPDMGTALALVFSRLHARTLGQFNQLLRKNQIDFYNRLGIRMRPCAPAEGFISFSLVNHSAEGIYLPEGVALTSDTAGEDGEKVAAETLDGVFVSPVQIQRVYESRKSPAFIGRLYSSSLQEGQTAEGFPWALFAMQEKNEVSHRFAFSHPSMFSFVRTGCLGLAFYGPSGNLLSEEVVSMAADPARAVFSYWTGENWEPFFRQYEKDGILFLEKKASQPPAARREIHEADQFWVQMELLDSELCGKIAFSDLRMTASGPSMAPDYVQSEGTEQEREFCLPFGEQPGVYGEVYFACREALDKRGAWIRFSFHEGFARIPVYTEDRDKIQWKLIMPHSSVSVSREYDITIEEVIWEYFNGYGWARLFPGKEYSDVFGTAGGTLPKRHTLVFQCPEDMAPVYVGAAETYYIRARIRKMNNAFKTEGQYIVPVLSELSFQYEYPTPGLRPSWFYCRSNMEEKFLKADSCLEGLYPWQPFWQCSDEEAAVYIGLDRPVTEGPVRMLWVIQSSGDTRRPALSWEYSALGGRFKELNPDDGTEHLKRTGLVTFEGRDDWEARTLFGETLYWIRIRDVSRAYGQGQESEFPVVEAVYMNGARIRTVHGGYEESFSVDQYAEHFVHQMLYGKICHLELWVNETGTLMREEETLLEKQGRLKRVLDGNGVSRELWVRWEETERFEGAGAGARVYQLDANEGRIQFGDNRNGRIPPIGVLNGIRLYYSIGGGRVTNLPPGGITGLEMAAGYINEATNPLCLSGGYDREGVEDAMKRRSMELRHRFRAVTLRDYEALAREACGGIARVRGISGFDGQGKPASGHVSLAVLQEDYKTGTHFFPTLRMRILQYLKDKVDPGLWECGRIHVVEPVLVQIGIRCELHIRDYSESYGVRSGLTRRLDAFLDPLTGGLKGEGWQIGELPEKESISGLIYSDSRILYAGNLMLHYVIRDGKREQEVSRGEIEKNPYLLTAGGTHHIVVKIEQGT